MSRTRLTTVESVPENGSFLFTVRERDGSEEEVILVRCDPSLDADADGDSDADSDGDSDTDENPDGDSEGENPDGDSEGENPDGDSEGENPDDDDPDDGTAVRAWRNVCQHETDQRLDRGFGAAVRDGEVVCPKHGSMFDTCSGYCDSGKAADSYLSGVDVAVDDGVVYLTDSAVTFAHEGGIDDDDEDDGPSSTSHLTF